MPPKLEENMTAQSTKNTEVADIPRYNIKLVFLN
jgi:hypothetical protein